MRQAQHSEDHDTRQGGLFEGQPAPIDFAPGPVRSRLVDAHRRPLVARRKGESFRVGPEAAWGYPFVELRAGNSFPAVIVDLDDPEARAAFRLAVALGDIPEPGWYVINPETGHLHAVWGLTRPVHRGHGAKLRPLAELRRVNAFYTHSLGGDPGFTGVLTRNPAHELHVTQWSHEPVTYSLSELAAAIPKGWRVPREYRDAGGVGRNHDVFRRLMRWSGRWRVYPAQLELDNVTAQSLAENEKLAEEGRIPLDLNETEGIARSVHRYALRNWSDLEERQRSFSFAQSQRAKYPRPNRKPNPASLSSRHPWVAEGVSRATWYRRRKASHPAASR